MWIWRRMEKISWLDKVPNNEVLRRVNEDRQILNSIWQRKRGWIGCVLRHNRLARNYWRLDKSYQVNQHDAEEQFQCYMTWQVMTAMLHSNGQMTERDGGRERMSKPVLQLQTTDNKLVCCQGNKLARIKNNAHEIQKCNAHKNVILWRTKLDQIHLQIRSHNCT